MSSRPKAKGAPRFDQGIFLDPVIPGRSASVLPRPKHLKPGLARAVRDGRVATRLTQVEHAARIGSKQSHVAGHESEHDNRAPSALQIAAADTPYAVRVSRWILGHHDHIVMPAPANEHGDNHLQRIAEVSQSCGSLPQQLSLCVVEGLTDTSLENVIEVADSSAAASLEVAQWARESLRKRRRRT